MNIEMAKIIIASFNKCSANKNNIWKILRRLALDGRVYFAISPLASEDILNILSWDDAAYVREAVAANRNTPAHVLERLALDNYVIRAAVARNESTAVSTLMQLSTDISSDIRCYVASNKKTTTEILALLSKYSDASIRTKVALHPHTSEDVLDTLARTVDSYTRICVAKNPNTGINTLLYLKNDHYAEIKDLAARKIEKRGGIGIL